MFKKIIKFLLSGLFVVVLSLLMLFVTALYSLRFDFVVQKIVSQFTDGLNFTIEFSDAHIDVLGRVSARNLKLAPLDKKTKIAADEILIRYDLLSLFYKKPILKQIDIQNLVLDFRETDFATPEKNEHKSLPTQKKTQETNTTPPSADALDWLVESAVIRAQHLEIHLPDQTEIKAQTVQLSAKNIGAFHAGYMDIHAELLSYNDKLGNRIQSKIQSSLVLPALTQLQNDKISVALELSNLNADAPSIKIDTGNLRADFSGVISKSGKLDLTITQLLLGKKEQAEAQKITLHAQADWSNPQKVTLPALALVSTQDNKTLLQIKTSGSIALNPFGLNLEINAETVNIKAFKGYLDASFPLKELEVSFQDTLKYVSQPLLVKSQLQLLLKSLESQESIPQFSRIAGSALKTNLTFESKTLTCNSCILETVVDAKSAGSVELSGTVALEETPQIAAKVALKNINADQWIALATSKNKPADTPAKTNKSTEPSSLKAPYLGSIELLVQNLIIQGNKIQNIAAQVLSDEKKAQLKSFKLTHSSGNLVANAEIGYGRNPVLKLNALAEEINLKEWLIKLAPEQAEFMKGTLKSLSMEFTGPLAGLDDSATGSMEMLAEDVTLPSKLQHYPPLNLIFLPFDVLADGIGGISGFIMPDFLNSFATGARSVLSEQGRLEVKTLNTKVTFSKMTAHIKHLHLVPNLLPSFKMEGDIGLDGSLRLTNYLTLMNAHVPLPVTGSLSMPLPDVVQFVPDLIRALGLSALDTVKDVGGLVGIK